LYTENSGGTVLELGLNPNGNVGIKVVPEAWTVFDGVLQIGSGGSVASSAGVVTRLSSNLYYDGAYKRIATGTATSYVQNNGDHVWNSTASGTLDVAFTETERMRIDSSGNVGIGMSPTRPLTVNGDNGTGMIINDATNDKALRFRATGDAFYIESTNNAESAYENLALQGNVGIGAVPNQILTLDKASGDVFARFDKSGAIKGLIGVADSAGAGSGSSAQGDMVVRGQTRLLLDTAGTTAVTIDNSQNVGIGTSSPARKLEISGGHARLSDGYNLEWGGGTNYIRGSSASNYVFVATNSTERLRIDASGNLLVGKTAASSNTVGFETSADGTCAITRSGAQPLLLNRQSGVGGDIILLRKDGATVGSISVTASATAYNTSSDQRLKDNIVDADDAGSKIDAIQVRKFDWKVDGSHQDYGMVAQELLEVAPEAVSQGETEDDMMAVDYSKLVPMMLKEIQSLRARIAALES
jgi:hypothetical protein